MKNDDETVDHNDDNDLFQRVTDGLIQLDRDKRKRGRLIRMFLAVLLLVIIVPTAASVIWGFANGIPLDQIPEEMMRRVEEFRKMPDGFSLFPPLSAD